MFIINFMNTSQNDITVLKDYKEIVIKITFWICSQTLDYCTVNKNVTVLKNLNRQLFITLYNYQTMNISIKK